MEDIGGSANARLNSSFGVLRSFSPKLMFCSTVLCG